MPTTDLSKPNTTQRERLSFSAPFAGETCEYASGGKFNAGMIKNVSIISLGEALGHDMFIDEVMLQQVADAINASDKGVKSRWTHPGMSSDGMGKATGRHFNARVEGEQVLADHHFYESAKASPDGDLPAYLMKLSKEDSTAFGLSISFRRDRGAMEAFDAQHKDPEGKFKSPHPKNAKNLSHVRLAHLYAGDFVDEPAANPNGLFHDNTELFELLESGDSTLSYLLGISNEKPEDELFSGIDIDRIKGFVSRTLAQKGYSLHKPDAPEDPKQLLARLTSLYGAEAATDAVLNNKPETVILQEQLTKLRLEKQEIQTQFDELKRFAATAGEKEPLSSGHKNEPSTESTPGFSPGAQQYINAMKKRSENN